MPVKCDVDLCNHAKDPGIKSVLKKPPLISASTAVRILNQHDTVSYDQDQLHAVSHADSNVSFQRGVYPPEDFTAVKKYGLNMLVTSDDQVKAYIKRIMSQLNKWMVSGKISKLVVVITSKETDEHVERWQFDVDIIGKSASKSKNSKPSGSADAGKENASGASQEKVPEKEKTEQEVQSEIAALFRQITASVTFLPTLDAFGPCTFNVLVYADADSDVPVEWGDSDAKDIEGGERVALRSFSTSGHKVGLVVGYKYVTLEAILRLHLRCGLCHGHV